MSSAKVIIRNLTANWVGFGTNLVVMFFLSPFIVHTLGVTQYGIWQLLTVLTGYMGILDLGVRASTGRYIILFLGKKEFDKVDETIRTGLGLYACVGGLIFVSSIIIASIFPWIFPSAPSEYHAVVSAILPILAVNIWVSALRTVLSSVLTAHERFDLSRGSDLIMLAIQTVGTVAALKFGYQLIGLTAAVVGSNIIGLLVTYYLANRIHVELKLWPLILKKERVSELWNYGIGAFIIAISAKIIGQTDFILVGNLISVDAVAVYGVGAMLLYYSNTVLGQIGYTFFPALQRAVAQDEMGSARWLLFRQIRLAMILGIAMFVGFIFFGEAFIQLWMFHPEKFTIEYVRQAALVMAILSGSKLLTLFSYGCRAILNATGHIGFSAKMTLVQAFSNLILSILFVVVLDWGLAGVAAGTFMARLLADTFIVPPYACQKAGIKYRSYLAIVGGRGVLTCLLFAAICYGVQQLLPCSDWWEFFTQVGLALLLYVPVALLLLVSVEDRRRLGDKIGKLLPSS